MIDSKVLLDKCQRLQKRLEVDLLERSQSADVPAVGEKLRKEYQEAFEGKRTGHAYEAWRQEMITQHAAAWVVTSVFVRFLEDNGFLPARLSGPRGDNPGDAHDRWLAAKDHYDQYFVTHRDQSDRDYLLHLFDELARIPALDGLFGKHNPLRDHPTWVSNDAAHEVIEFFRRLDPGTGQIELDFTTPKGSARHPDSAEGQREETRFLGDLYQDLSEDARKRFALLQTPDFVERFILDRTMEPAWEEWVATGKPGGVFRMIDPACGSGHFLLGSFHRILNHWQRLEPAASIRELVQRTLDSVHGVDVNPFAIAISRFRLLIAALRACEITRIQDAPDFRFHLACGDSLLHGAEHKIQQDFVEMPYFYQPEDLEELRRILVPGQFQAVVANPPYITVKDKALNEEIRKRYPTCHRKYSLSVPFIERIFQLASKGGHTGQITADSFMKREFGCKLIEEFFPLVDLTHVIHTSGAYIPGHGTPTVILFGRQRKPSSPVVRAVLGIQGEPTTPIDPSKGLVWSAILEQVDQPGSETRFISSLDMDREKFHNHPWSIGGGGASELKNAIDNIGKTQFSTFIDTIGFGAILGEDDAFGVPFQAPIARAIPQGYSRPLVEGDKIRDWSLTFDIKLVFPYDNQIVLVQEITINRWLWERKVILSNRRDFSNQTYSESGKPWWSYHQIPRERNRTPLSIAFAFVATHNHFVLERGGKVFKQSAPVIKLPQKATEDDHLTLVGLLNSSTAGFWMRQVFHNKGGGGIGGGIATETWEQFLEYEGTKLKQFPIPWGDDHDDDPRAYYPYKIARFIDQLAQKRSQVSPAHLCSQSTALRPEQIQEARELSEALFQTLVYLQEELDWVCYEAYGLLPDKHPAGNRRDEALDIVPLKLGQRPFEIALARKVAAGEEKTEWFNRHGSTPITEIPGDWPENYRKVVEHRLKLIDNHPDIALIEKPEFKRRWNQEPWDEQLQQALKDWLLLRLERYLDLDNRMVAADCNPSVCRFYEPELVSIGRIAQIAGQDDDFLQMGALYTKDNAFDVFALVSQLIEAETVPLLPVCRYKGEGLIKRTVWERTWDLQRAEDRGEAVGTIPVPPKYTTADFQKADFWRLRGKLDVPKERWVGFPHVVAADGSALVAWAGYDHLQLAQAISGYFVQVQEREGGSEDPRLEPLLACLAELIPWLKQWHNEIDPEFGQGMGDYFAGFADEEARKLGRTLEQVRQWQPPAKSTARKEPVRRVKAVSEEVGETEEAGVAAPKAKRARKSDAEREAQLAKVIELARSMEKLTNRSCLEGLGLESNSSNTTLVSQLLKELSGPDGPLVKVGVKGPGVYYTLKG